MKEFTVISGPKYNPVIATVQINAIDADARLTPAMAERAARVACGGRNRVTVWSNDGHGYRLYANRCRKLKRDPEELDQERAEILAREATDDL